MQINESSPAAMDTRKRSTKEDCIVAAKVFAKDVQIFFSRVGRAPQTVTNTRSKIREFSKRSAKRLRHMVRNAEDQLKTFITLTYPADFPCDGKTTKRHLNAFLQYLRRKGIKYVWVLEFQLRGAPHYHIIATGFISKTELAERWYKIVGSNDERHLRAGTSIDYIRSKKHLYGYLSNYVKKLDQKTPPLGFENVGRFWGASRNLLIYAFHYFKSTYYGAARSIRLLRKWYCAHTREWGFKWRWQGQGFTVYDGAAFFAQLKMRIT